MISVKFNNTHVYKTVISFSGGELNPTLTWSSPFRDVKVEVLADIRSSNDVMELILTVDAIRRLVKPTEMLLDMPYLPYARQDRVCNKGESLGVKVMADLINSLNFDEVIVSDCHSDVGVALLNNCTHRDQSLLASLPNKYDAIICPDAGAMKKTLKLAAYVGVSRVVMSDKIRDVATGEITHTKIHLPDDLSGLKSLLVVDDICDGGRTFIELGKKLKSSDITYNNLDLHVTHGIFSKGKESLLEYFNSVTATYDWTEE